LPAQGAVCGGWGRTIGFLFLPVTFLHGIASTATAIVGVLAKGRKTMQIEMMEKAGSSILNTVLRPLAGIRDLVLPATCLACDNEVSEQGVVCSSCWPQLRFIERPYCEVLGSPFSYDLGKGALSAAAIAAPPAFARARSVVLYDDVARQLVQGLKFSDRTDLAPWIAQWMVRAADGLLDGGPVIVPVPLHRLRLMGRRFNQSAELARYIAQDTDGLYLPEALVRVRATRQQVGLGAKERIRNVQGAFRVPKERKIDVQERRILLIDDVFTTGATLEACARALRRGGAGQIDCLTFARVAPDGV